MKFYEFQVKFTETTNPINKKPIAVRQGVVCGNSYAHATQSIIDYYGENLISLSIEEWDAEGCLEMSKICLDFLRNDKPF